MTQRTSICYCWRFGWDTLFFLDMDFVRTLMYRFFATRTFFKVFTIFALTNEMCCISKYLDCLTTLLAYHKHRASIIQMQVPVILILKLFVKPFAKITNKFWIRYIFRSRNIDKFVIGLLKIFSFVFNWYFMRLIWFSTYINGSIIIISIIMCSSLMEFFLNYFYYLGP